MRRIIEEIQGAWRRHKIRRRDKWILKRAQARARRDPYRR